jgi:hypothetical protein
MKTPPIPLAVLLVLAACAQPKAAPGVTVGARITGYRLSDGLGIQGPFRVNEVDGTRARLGRISDGGQCDPTGTWVDFSKVTTYQ